jgi:hypothetical protein
VTAPRTRAPRLFGWLTVHSRIDNLSYKQLLAPLDDMLL